MRPTSRKKCNYCALKRNCLNKDKWKQCDSYTHENATVTHDSTSQIVDNDSWQREVR